MSLKAFNCGLPKLPKKTKSNPDPQLSEVEKRVQTLGERLLATRRAVSSEMQEQADATAAVALHRWEQTMKMAEGEVLRPGNSERTLQHILAREFAVWYDNFGFGKTPTKSGAVRQELIRADRLYRGTIDEALSRLEVAKHMELAQKAIAPLRKQYKISKSEWSRMTLDAVEVGWHPYLEDAINIGNVGRELLATKQRRLLSQFESFGMSTEDIIKVTDAGKQVAQKYNEVLEIAQRSGVSIENFSDVMGYYPRVFTEEAMKRVEWSKEGEKLTFTNTAKQGKLDDAFTTSRKTFDWVVEDDIVLDHLLTNHDPDIYKKLGVENIGELVTDEKKMGKALIQHLDTDVLDKLVDSGVASKIPMMTSEVYEMMVKRYDLPFEGLGELVLDDWGSAARHYQEQLQNLASDSGKAWLMMRNGIEESWGVPKAEFELNPSKYKGFRPLSDLIPDRNKNLFGMLDNQLPPNIAKEGAGLSSTLDNIYMHPIAADMYEAMQNISKSPHNMSYLARMFDNLNSVFKGMVLSTSGTVSRIMWSNAVMTMAAGGNLFDLMVTTPRYIAATIANNYKFFDNTKKLYRGIDGIMVTERELHYQAIGRGIISKYTALSSDSVTQTNKAKNYVARSPKYIMEAYSKYGAMAGIEETAGLVKYLGSDVAGHPFRVANNILDNAAKFSILKAQLRSTDTLADSLATVGKVVTSGKAKSWKNLDVAGEHLAEYFFKYDDLGRMDKTIAKYVRPFWVYLSRNPVAQVRHAMREPSKYMAFQRLYALANAPAAAEGEDLPDGGINEYVKNTNPIYWIIPEEDSASGKREVFAIPLVGVDPITDGLKYASDMGNAALNYGASLFGKNWQDKKTRDEKPWESATETTLAKVFKDTYPLYQAVYKSIAGKDLDGKSLLEDPTGRKTTSFLGVQVDPMLKMWGETLVPTLANINRANPGHIFGTPDRVNPDTGEMISKGTPSVFGAERTDADRGDWTDSQIQQYPFLKFLRMTGVNVSKVDVLYQMGYTEDNIRYALSDGRKKLSQMQADVAQEDNPKVKQEKMQRLEQFSATWVSLQVEYQRVLNWRSERGVGNNAYKRLVTQGKAPALPPISEKQRRAILKKTEVNNGNN